MNMIPGEYRLASATIEMNRDRDSCRLIVKNTGDRPIQVGSHYHFYEVNRALTLDRAKAFGKRLNIAAGTAVRFEPGEEKPVELVGLGGKKTVFGLNGLTSGSTALSSNMCELQQRLRDWEGGTNG
jgi:urease subunit beta